MSRLRLDLSTRMTQEDLLIQRIRDLPKERRQEYVRNLLLKGFEQECPPPGPDRRAQHPDITDGASGGSHTEPASDRRSQRDEPVAITLRSLKNVVG